MSPCMSRFSYVKECLEELSLVSSLFSHVGPLSRDVMVLNAINQAHIGSVSDVVFHHLRLPNPFMKWLLDMLKEYERKEGDGSKRLLFMIYHALDSLSHHITLVGANEAGSLLNSIYDALQVIVSEWDSFEGSLISILFSQAIRIAVPSSYSLNSGYDLTNTSLITKKFLQSLLLTLWTGHLPSNTLNTLSNLLINAIDVTCNQSPNSSLSVSIHSLEYGLDELYFFSKYTRCASGAPLSNSTLCPGVLLDKQPAHLSMRGKKWNPIRLIIFKYSLRHALFGLDDGQWSHTMTLESESHTASSNMLKKFQNLEEEILASFSRDKQVNCIVSGQLFPPSTLQACVTHNILVLHGVEAEDLRMLSNYCAAPIIQSLCSDGVATLEVGQAVSAEECVIGSRLMMKIQLLPIVHQVDDERKSSVKIVVHTFIFRGIHDMMCQQYMRQMLRALVYIRQWIKFRAPINLKRAGKEMRMKSKYTEDAVAAVAEREVDYMWMVAGGGSAELALYFQCLRMTSPFTIRTPTTAKGDSHKDGEEGKVLNGNPERDGLDGGIQGYGKRIAYEILASALKSIPGALYKSAALTDTTTATRSFLSIIGVMHQIFGESEGKQRLPGFLIQCDNIIPSLASSETKDKARMVTPTSLDKGKVYAQLSVFESHENISRKGDETKSESRAWSRPIHQFPEKDTTSTASLGVNSSHVNTFIQVEDALRNEPYLVESLTSKHTLLSYLMHIMLQIIRLDGTVLVKKKPKGMITAWNTPRDSSQILGRSHSYHHTLYSDDEDEEEDEEDTKDDSDDDSRNNNDDK